MNTHWLHLAKLCVPLLLVVATGGCVTKSTANAQARAAYVAGQQEGMARMQQAQTLAQGPTVSVNGEVRNHVVPWTEGLTLAKALVAADYYGATDPGQVMILRGGVVRRYEAKQLLGGVDIPLQPGDVVHLVPQNAAPKR